MAVNISGAVSAALALSSALVIDVEKAITQANGAGLISEGTNLVEIALADPAVKASFAALVAAL